MKNLVFTAMLFFLFIKVAGQNLIGFNDEEIKKFMKENRKEMNFEKVTNSHYRYLKYCSNSDDQTILFFLDKRAICNNIRIICAESIRNIKMNELNSMYKKSGENTWIDVRKENKYLISLKDEEWSFVITMKPEKKSASGSN